jgi:glycosyltransferase involved in cell wall biosynthesis
MHPDTAEGKRRSVIFFNRFFFPDTSATSQMLSDLAFHLASCGHNVQVVTSRTGDREPSESVVRGVTIHRVATALTGPHSLFERALAYLAYWRGARSAARRLVRAGDVVVVKTDPPLLSAIVGPLAKRLGAKVVVWLQDVFPETANEYGVPGAGGPIGALLRRVRDQSLASADHVVAISDRMAQRVARLPCVRSEHLSVIHNWADSTIVPIDPTSSESRRRWQLADKFVVGYSGNLGRVHEFDTMLRAAKTLETDRDIRFLIVGRGPRWAEVQSRAKRENLRNVRLEPYQERDALTQTLGASDVHLSVLRPEYEGLVHPSKLYGIMAAGRPTIFIGDPKGETAAILAGTGAGVTVATGDVGGLVQAIRSLRDRPEERQKMGARARKALEERYSTRQAVARWEALLSSLP